MGKSLIIYDMKNKSNVEKTHIVRSLFGYTDKSNKGKYVYKREGLISRFKYEKWNKSAIVINSKHEADMRDILNKFGLRVLIVKLPVKKD